MPVSFSVPPAPVELTFAAAVDARSPIASWLPTVSYAVDDVVITNRGDRIKCITAHTSSAEFTDDLPYWVSVDAPAVESTRLQLACQAKGGVIGVGDVGVVAFRFDDGNETFHSTVYPLLTARGIPASFAAITTLSAQTWSDGDTSANMLTRNQNGIEVWSHGTDHKDPSPNGLDGTNGLVDQIVNSKAVIEGWGIKCQGWAQPGATQLGTPTPYGTGFTDDDSLRGYAALLIRQTYPISEMYVTGTTRNVPNGQFHGLDHVTISDGITYAAAQALVDRAIRLKTGVVLMVHAHNLGVGSNLTVGELTTLLDYIVTCWDAGTLDVVTPSGLMFADKGSTRVELLAGAGTFEDAALWNLDTGRTIPTNGGHSGNNYLSTTSSTTSLTTPVNRPDNLTERRFDGETFLFEGWARSNGVSTTVSRVVIQSYPSTSLLNLSLTKSGITTSWTRVRHAFTVPPTCNEITIGLGRNSGDGIDWDDVTIRKV